LSSAPFAGCGRQSLGAAAGAGAGLLATIAAASTGLLGWCGGSAFSGSMFALAGLGSASAAALSAAFQARWDAQIALSRKMLTVAAHVSAVLLDYLIAD
jgi:hypothetical protein